MNNNTLIYLGASFDNSFLFHDLIKHKYQKYILYDILPDLSFYDSEEYGITKVNNEKTFIHTLKSQYGNYVRNKNRLYFPKYNLIYHIYTDCDHIKHLPKGDILMKNYVPVQYKELLHDRNIWINCDTIHKVENIEYNTIHLEEYYLDCYCYCEFLENI